MSEPADPVAEAEGIVAAEAMSIQVNPSQSDRLLRYTYELGRMAGAMSVLAEACRKATQAFRDQAERDKWREL